MSRLHGLAISLLLAVATGTGAYAMMVTAKLGKATSKPEVASARAIAKQKAQLDKWSASLAKSLRAKPPALPALPRYRPVTFFTLQPNQALPVVATATQPTTVQSTRTAATTSVRQVVSPAPHPTALHASLSSTFDAEADDDDDTPPKTTPASRPTRTEAAAPDTDFETTRNTPPAFPEVAAPAAPQDPPVAAATVAAAPTPGTVAAAPTTAPTTSTTTTTTTTGTSARQAVEQQCQALKRAAEGGTEAAKQAAEHQCEALKDAHERRD